MIGLRKLIVREVAYMSRGLFLINAASNQMVECRATSDAQFKKMAASIRSAVTDVKEGLIFIFKVSGKIFIDVLLNLDVIQ